MLSLWSYRNSLFWGYEVIITTHAIDKFRKITNCNKSDKYVRKKLFDMFLKSKEVIKDFTFKQTRTKYHRPNTQLFYLCGNYFVVLNNRIMLTYYTSSNENYLAVDKNMSWETTICE